MQQSGQDLGNSCLGGNRRDDRKLRSIQPTDFGQGLIPMHEIVATPLDSSRRWWVLAIVVAT
jgi:hypothetical protein